MVIYRENPKESKNPKRTKTKFPELISELSKVRLYKIKIQQSIIFLYTSHEHKDTEIKYMIQFTITQKGKIEKKYLSVNLTKYLKDIYAENYSRLMKEIKENVSKGTFYAYGLEELT